LSSRAAVLITPVKKVADFTKEVWRRRVFHIAIPYGVVSWVLLQVADVVLPAFDPPAWVFKALLFTLAAGFPVAVIIAWIFDYGPKGIVRTSVQDLLKADKDDPEGKAQPKPAPAIALELGKSERRRVTMLHCAVRVNSLDDDELDLEDLATLLKGIEQISNAIVEQYEGFRLPGNPEEVSIVFGYPHAHDDDARRAVAAGVALLERIETMSFPGVSEGEVSVSTHAAAHSGLVVVDDSNADGTGISIVGRVPRITSWLETMAPDNALVVSQFTHRLISPYFKSIDLGSKESVQLGGSFNVFHIERALEPGDENPLEEHVSDMLVGRDHELRLLEDRWENVVEGDQQYVLMKGEAGIGKSSIVRAFRQYASQTANAWLVSWHCSPYEQNSEFHPVIQSLMSQFFEFKEQDSNDQKLEKIEEVLLTHSVDSEAAIPLLANLLSLDLPGDSRHQLSSATSQVLRNRTMELLVNLFRSLASQKPVLLMVESLHCSDPSTRELIKMILEHGSIPGMFLFMTSRPDYRPDWSNRSSVMEFDVQCLSRRSSGQMVKKIAGDRELPESLIKRIVDETDGIPMYILALTRALFESDEWQNDNEFSSRELASIHIPATLQESLAARLDKLGSAKTLLQVCSLLGREFSYKLLLAVSETDNEKALKEELNRVVDADMLFKRRTGSELTYTFRHILIQEAASQSLLKSTRKILHIRIAQAKETQFPETVAQRPQKLAYHFSEGGMNEKAIQYWTAAGRRSVMRSANREALEDARAGLKLIDKLPESNERNMMEIPLQSILGSALLGSQGYTAPEVKDVFTRARKLCEQIDNDEHLFQVLVGLWMYYEVSAEYTYALDIGSQLIRIANSTGNAGQLVQAHYSQGYTQFYRGEFEAAKEQFEQALSFEVKGGDFSSQSASGDDTRTHVRCMLAHAYWHLGMPKTASKFAREANKLAHELEQPYAITFISFFNGWFHQFRREPHQTIAYAEECVELAKENGYGFFIPLGNFLLAWAEIHSPEPESGSENQGQLEKMKTFLEISLGTGVGTGVSYLLFLFAEVLVELGRYDEALEQLEYGRKHVERVGERFLESEYYRLKGCVFLARYRDNKERLYLDGAIDHLTQALSRAKIKHDKGLALRAAIDLAHALSQRGDQDGAVDTIDSVLSTFEETDKSGDFIRARELRKKLQ
jgi:tetratricopeptide (TPR) repeat protein/class 3 adenylate cyclase